VLEVATTRIDEDGFAVGVVTNQPADPSPAPSTWIVIKQAPDPGKKRPAGASIDLVMADPTTACP
jgi:hypothetical protein